MVIERKYTLCINYVNFQISTHYKSPWKLRVAHARKMEISTTFPLERFSFPWSFHRCLSNNNPIEILVYSCLRIYRGNGNFTRKFFQDMTIFNKTRVSRMSLFRFLVLVIYVNSSLPGRFKSVVHNRSDYTSSSCLEKLEFITTKTFLQSFFSFLVFSNLI